MGLWLISGRGSLTVSFGTGNLALNKPVRQSSDYPNSDYIAQKAVDGNTDGSDFSHTEAKANQWWMVDLGGQYEVTNIELYNRKDRKYNLQKIYILTSNEATAPPDPNPTFEKWTVRYYHHPPYGDMGNIILEEGVFVRHVAVFSSHDEGVTLVEAKVYAYRNLAYKCRASQSTTYGNLVAKKAVDGVLYGKLESSHTNGDKSWWKVDLGKNRSVAQVVLYSGTGEASNLALNKPAKQSSNYSNSDYFAQKAVDGNTDGSDFSRTEAKANQWWMVDLGKQYEITKVELNSGKSGRPHRQQVYILTSIEATPPDPYAISDKWPSRCAYSSPFGGTSYIKLEKGVFARHVAALSYNDEGVTLAEFKVYGYSK
ncbi:uncharacterized protein [Watersipora subatra]|uniref:uncharacterized protein n=1 Tax=Watersipora subatra TaxID=2589382 RepID=UPI00355B0FED